MKSKRPKPRSTPSQANLDAMIEEATGGAYGDSEQIMGFFCMLEEHLELPFQTEVPGIEVTVEDVDVTEEDQLVAVCSRGKSRQRISVLDLPLPSRPPEGAEWIEAFRRWARGRAG